MSRLQGDLHVKKNGNVMMNAIMRGLKQKLEEEMAKSRQTVEAQSNEIVLKDARLEALEAKI